MPHTRGHKWWKLVAAGGCRAMPLHCAHPCPLRCIDAPTTSHSIERAALCHAPRHPHPSHGPTGGHGRHHVTPLHQGLPRTLCPSAELCAVRAQDHGVCAAAGGGGSAAWLRRGCSVRVVVAGVCTGVHAGHGKAQLGSRQQAATGADVGSCGARKCDTACVCVRNCTCALCRCTMLCDACACCKPWAPHGLVPLRPSAPPCCHCS